MDKIDFTKAVGIGEVPQGAIDKANEWLNNAGDITVLTCWFDAFEVHLTVKIVQCDSVIISGIRIFDISDKWVVSQDFNTIVK